MKSTSVSAFYYFEVEFLKVVTKVNNFKKVPGVLFGSVSNLSNVSFKINFWDMVALI